MKKLIVLGIAMMLIVACQQQEQRYFAESDEINTLKAGIDAYEAGDWDKWKSHFADTAKIYVNSKDGISADARMNDLKAAVENFSSYGFNREKEYVEMVLDKEKETWVYYWAQWNGELSTNKKTISVPVHLALQFIDGKIAEEHIFFDGTEMNKEITALTDMSDLDEKIYGQIDILIDNFTNKQDSSVLNGLIAEDHVRYINDVKVAAGSTELQTSMTPYFTGFPDFNIEILHKSGILDQAIFIHWKMTGTNDGEFDGSPATGKKVEVNGLTRLHFTADGKMDSEHIHFDRLQLMEQLGKSLN